ncbi:MAG TPA: TlpA disulfide reductase family protein [Pseudonocardiaceae bacterium]|jgi:thiol-disulfide isomerase/thioredoxin|nr:TlpA disulfide reductase family protein [Pseudonocardiaceae bacterium]
MTAPAPSARRRALRTALRRALRRRVLRWALVAVVLVVALAVALWPRGSPASPVSAPTTALNLTPDRVKAALAACPLADGAAGAVSSASSAAWSGVRTTCEATGATVDLGAVLAGPPTLVNVWATWCSPCQTELPVLADYAAGPGAVRVLTVQTQSDQRDGLDLLASLGVHLSTLFDGDGADGPVSRALRLPVGLPVSYLVRGGTATLITHPRVFDSVDQVRHTLSAAMAGTPS